MEYRITPLDLNELKTLDEIDLRTLAAKNTEMRDEICAAAKRRKAEALLAVRQEFLNYKSTVGTQILDLQSQIIDSGSREATDHNIALKHEIAHLRMSVRERELEADKEILDIKIRCQTEVNDAMRTWQTHAATITMALRSLGSKKETE